MSKVTSYAPGTPCWVDLSCADIDASMSFYGDLLGWEFEEPGGPETGGYRRARYEGDEVAGLMPKFKADEPQFWNTHISVADAAETTKAAGGQLLNGPFDIPVGRIAILMDPQGAMLAVMAPTDETRATAP